MNTSRDKAAVTRDAAPSGWATVAVLAGDYPEKFGVPRQPGLVAAARGVVSLVDPYDDPRAVEGIDAYSHLWLSFVFDRSPAFWRARVRPPRLGGNRRVGVFATRSTHRPNRLGLSLVRLCDVATFDRPAPAPWPVPGSGHARSSRTHLRVAGHDLVDGTPIVDIKPYLPWADARADAHAAWAGDTPEARPVHLAEAARRFLDTRADGEALAALIVAVLARDPRPAYHRNDVARTYGVALRDVNVRFRIEYAGGPPAIRVESIAPRTASDQPPI